MDKLMNHDGRLEGSYRSSVYHNAVTLIQRAPFLELFRDGVWQNIQMRHEPKGDAVSQPVSIKFSVAIFGTDYMVEDQPVRVTDQGEFQAHDISGLLLLFRMQKRVAFVDPKDYLEAKIFPYDEVLMVDETKRKFPIPR